MHSNTYDVFYSNCSHQHVSADIPTIIMVTLLQEHSVNVQIWWTVSTSLHNNYTINQICKFVPL